MKSYPHIISKLFYEPLVITKAKHFAIWKVLERRLAGESVQMPPMDEEDDDGEDMIPEWDVGHPTTLINVHGILGQHLDGMAMMSGGCDLTCVNQQLTQAIEDPAVKRIVFDFNTPGGSATGIPELAEKIANCPKETIGFTDSECCSGGIWLASQCTEFFATPSSSVGSIGVWCAYLDLSRQMANEGENMQEISAGKYKTMGAYWKPLTTEEKAMIQVGVDKIYGQFTEAVKRKREIPKQCMEGQIYDGEEAAKLGMCALTEIDGLDELLS